MTTLTVKVEQRHIDAGYRGSSRRCPIALALVEALSPHYPVTPEVEVGYGTWYLRFYGDDRCDAFVFELPDFAIRFAKCYDGGLSVSPFTFQITLP